MKVILRPNWSLAMMGEVAIARNKPRLGDAVSWGGCG